MPDGKLSPEVSLPTPQFEFVDPQEAQIKIHDYGYTVKQTDSTSHIDETGKVFTRIMTNYITGPLLTDTFTSHRNQRVLWEEKQPIPTQDLLNQNRIGINRLTRVYTIFSFIMNGYGITFPIDDDFRIEVEDLIRTIKLNKNRTIQYKVLDGQIVGDEQLLTEEEQNRVETYYADDPDHGYDKLTTEEKLSIVNRADNIVIRILEQNGFTVTPKPLPPTPS